MAETPDISGKPSSKRAESRRLGKPRRRPILGCELLENRRLLSQTPSFPPQFTGPSWQAAIAHVSGMTAPESPVYSQGAAVAHLTSPVPWTSTPPFGITAYLTSTNSSWTALPRPAVPLVALHPLDFPQQAIAFDGDGPTHLDERLSPQDGTKLFRVDFTEDSHTVEVIAENDGSGPRPDLEFGFYTADGMPIANYGLPGPDQRISFSIDSRAPGTLAGSAVLIGISSMGGSSVGGGTSASSNNAVDSFSLSFSRNDGTPATTGPIVSIGTQSASSVTSTTASSSPAAEEVLTVGLGDDSLGPMPMRSVGPSAGVLSDELLTPPVDRNEAVVVDLSLIDLATEQLAEFTVGRKIGGVPANGLVEIRSQGGFPLLGTTVSFSDADAERVDDLAPSIARSPATDPAPIQNPDPLHESDPTNSRTAIILGIGLAGSLGYTLMLPDLESRLEPETPKRPLPWKTNS